MIPIPAQLNLRRGNRSPKFPPAHSDRVIAFFSTPALSGTNNLKPPSPGAPDKPILIDRYGSGPRPRIDANGTIDDAVLLRNIQFIQFLFPPTDAPKNVRIKWPMVHVPGGTS